MLRNVWGKLRMCSGMPVPRRNVARSCVKLLQLWRNKSYDWRHFVSSAFSLSGLKQGLPLEYTPPPSTGYTLPQHPSAALFDLNAPPPWGVRGACYPVLQSGCPDQSSTRFRLRLWMCGRWRLYAFLSGGASTTHCVRCDIAQCWIHIYMYIYMFVLPSAQDPGYVRVSSWFSV